MKKVVAFADEFGNNSFKFDIQGSHFIIASIIINRDELDVVQQKLEYIRKKYFQTGEIKSNKVGKNHKRRILILNELQDINFTIYAVVVDKKKLYSEGFKYKKSFYKFLNGILYKELYKTFPQLDLKVDEHGGNDFMKNFKKYVQKNHIRTLFEGSEFNIEKSHNELGVQLADFVAGTLGYIFDDLKKSEKSREFHDLLKSKLNSINHFPKKYSNEEFNDDETYSEYDRAIAQLGLTRAFDYIDTTTGNDQKNLDRLNFVKLLLLFHQSNHPKKYTTAEEFITHLNANREKKLSKEQFSSKVVGHLRDKGLLIASSRNGYKIPTSANDMIKFIRHGNRIIIPLLKRIQESRNAISLATVNEYDIVDKKEFEVLKDLLETYTEHL